MSQQAQNLEGGQPQAVPQDPEYQLQEHIAFKRKQQVLNHTFRDIIQKNLSEFQLIMDGTNYAFTKLTAQNKGIQQVTEVICAYPHLRKIDLGFNQLKQIGFLQKLKFVVELNLQRNLIEDMKFLQLSDGFPYLKKINLQGNKIQTLTLVQVQNLTHLNLNNNKIKTLQDFEGHAKLQVLQLRKNKITSLKGLSKMEKLKQLYLADNQVSSLHQLQNLPNLIRLHARKNKLQSMQQFPDLPSLKYLNLRQNLVKSLDQLKEIAKNVEILNILACPLSQQLGDNTKKQIWMRNRNFQRINKVEVGAQQKQQFDKEWKERLAEQQRQRQQREVAQKESKQAAQRQKQQQQDS